MTIISASLNTVEPVPYTFTLAFLLSGWANWYLGNKWNNAPGRIVIDEASGERIELKPRHTFFWIKMQYWGTVLLSIGGLILFTSLIRQVSA